MDIHASQRSDWSFDRPGSSARNNSTGSKKARPLENGWTETSDEPKQGTKRERFFILKPLACGVLIGALVGGIALATVLTLWLTSTSTSTSASVSTSSSTSATTTSSVTTVTSVTTTTSSTTTTPTTSTTTRTTTSTTATTTVTMAPNLLINPGAEAGTLSPWVIVGTGTPVIDDGTMNSGYNPYSGTKHFYGGSISTGATSTLTQTVLLLSGAQGYTATQLDNGTLRAYINFVQQSYYQLVGTDDCQVSLDFRSLNTTLIFTDSTNYISCTNGWCSQSASYLIPRGTRLISYTMNFYLVVGNFIDAYIDDNSLRVY